jgi:hypothetical protein
MHFVKLHVIRLFLCAVMVSATAYSAEAKNKRLDKKIVEAATELAKDREAHFAGSKAMSLEEFGVQWTALVAELDKNYEGHTIKLKTFGNDVRTRKGFTHLLYMALRVQEKSTVEPLVQDVIGRHPFLQELTVEGACYTGGDAFPKKMKDLLKAFPGIQGAIRAKLDSWDKQYRKKFEKEFGNAG